MGRPALVSGHSSGALLAANRPDLVSGLLLEDPPFYSSIMRRTARTTGGAIFPLARDFLAQSEERDFQRYCVDTVLKSIKVPSVLLHTNDFQQTTGNYYQNGILMAAMDGAEKDRTLVLLADEELVEVASGHLVHFERPDAYLDAFARLSARVP